MSDFLESLARLETAINDSIEAKVVDLHTFLPATILSVDLNNQLVKIQIGVKRVYVDGVARAVPPILEVPLGVLRGGGWVITLPVTIGDQGCAFFSEREMTQWMLAGDQEPQTPLQIRKHDYTDAYFLPALASSARKISNYSTTALEIRSLDNMTKQTFNSTSIVTQVGAVTVTVDSTGLKVNGGTISSNIDVLGGLTNISLVNHEHISAASGSPTSPPIP